MHDPGDPQSLNRYSYVLNNPLRYIDPTGRVQYEITIRSFAPFVSFGGGFHGDNRGYSLDVDASARIHQKLSFDTDTNLAEVKTWSDPSYHQLFPKLQRTSQPVGEMDLTRATLESTESYWISAYYAGSNPLTPGAPAIDVYSMFFIQENRENRTLTISSRLRGDNFPSTEAFITDPLGQSIFIGIGFFEGSPYTSLWGNHKDRVISDMDLVILTDESGHFEKVLFNGKYYSLSDWNLLYEIQDPYQGGN